MNIDFLLDTFREFPDEEAVIWREKAFSYRYLAGRVEHWNAELEKQGVKGGEVVVLSADFSPDSIALFLSLTEKNCIIVPLTRSVREKRDEFLEIAGGELLISVDDEDAAAFTRLPGAAGHELYSELRARRHPGLVLFSSGSTGKSKAALHDLTGILGKFKVRKKKFRTIAFLLYDHIGGINTMLYVLSNGGCIVAASDRSPGGVARLVEKHKVELLPTSPTFINLMLLSGVHEKYDLSSLKVITYGTEPMPESTLKRLNALMPAVTLQQTYGLSEIGILRSRSRSSGSLWVKLGGEGFETRVVDGLLEVKAESAMLGYLNAPSPFTADGWFRTGDQVETDGEYFRILGRRSELINVGGEKVYPAEVESVILELDEVSGVAVYGEKHPVMGQIVCAAVRVPEQADQSELKRKIKSYCRGRLQNYKIPVRIKFTSAELHSERFKKSLNGVRKEA